MLHPVEVLPRGLALEREAGEELAVLLLEVSFRRSVDYLYQAYWLGLAASAAMLVSCGRPFPGHRLRIVNPDGCELPERQVVTETLRITAANRSMDKEYFLFNTPPSKLNLVCNDTVCLP